MYCYDPAIFITTSFCPSIVLTDFTARPRPQDWMNFGEHWMDIEIELNKDGLNWMDIEIELNKDRLNWMDIEIELNKDRLNWMDIEIELNESKN